MLTWLPGQVSVSEVGFVGKCLVVLGIRLWLEALWLHAWREVLAASLPSSHHGHCQTLGCCPFSLARDPLGHVCHHPVCLGAVAQLESRGLCLLVLFLIELQ